MRRFWLPGHLLLVGMLSACAQTTVVNTPKGVKLGDALNANPVTAEADWAYVRTEKGAEYTAYYDEDLRLHLSRGDGKKELTFGLKPEGSYTTGLALAASGDKYALIWRDKIPNKLLFLSEGSRDGEPSKPVNIDDGYSEPLSALSLSYDETGKWRALWIGEQQKPGDPKDQNHQYFRYQGGDAERVLPGQESTLVDDGEGGVWVFGQQYSPKPLILGRHRPAGETKFGEPIAVAEVERYGPIFRAWAQKGKLIVLWSKAMPDATRSENEFGYAVSTDKGVTWVEGTIKGREGWIWGGVDVVVNTDGSLLFVKGGRTRNEGSGRMYGAIEVQRSVDGGKTLSEPIRLNNNSGDYAHAHAPRLYFVEGGVMALWTDWRELRPQLYGAFSRDGGQSWAQSEQKYVVEGAKRLMLPTWKQNFFVDGDGPYAIAQSYEDDANKKYKLHKLPLTTAALGIMPAPQPDQQKLKERFGEYWGGMKERNWAKVFSVLDPYAQEMWSLDQYQARRGPMQYRSAEIESMEINGALAKVKAKIVVYVPEIKRNRQKVNEAGEHELSFEERWLWIDGQWYREYHEEGSGLKFAKYDW